MRSAPGTPCAGARCTATIRSRRSLRLGLRTAISPPRPSSAGLTGVCRCQVSTWNAEGCRRGCGSRSTVASRTPANCWRRCWRLCRRGDTGCGFAIRAMASGLRRACAGALRMWRRAKFRRTLLISPAKRKSRARCGFARRALHHLCGRRWLTGVRPPVCRYSHVLGAGLLAGCVSPGRGVSAAGARAGRGPTGADGIRGPAGCGARGMEGYGSLPQEPVCNRFETGKAVLYWAANAAVFLVAREVYGSTNTRNRFLRGILSFGAAVGLLTVVQYFTSEAASSGYFRSRSAGARPVSLPEPMRGFHRARVSIGRVPVAGGPAALARVRDHRRRHVRHSDRSRVARRSGASGRRAN